MLDVGLWRDPAMSFVPQDIRSVVHISTQQHDEQLSHEQLSDEQLSGCKNEGKERWKEQSDEDLGQLKVAEKLTEQEEASTYVSFEQKKDLRKALICVVQDSVHRDIGVKTSSNVDLNVLMSELLGRSIIKHRSRMEGRTLFQEIDFGCCHMEPAFSELVPLLREPVTQDDEEQLRALAVMFGVKELLEPYI
eukprot:Trichotokara_eunicae@DN5536_c0_g1_i1.p1